MIPNRIGGVSDHVHLLVTLPTTFAVAKAVQLIKAGSSAWIHQTFPNLRNFAWQQGYGAFSVGISQARSITSSSSSNIIEREPFKKSI
jgi:REP element-mobilizing transposase RayT